MSAKTKKMLMYLLVFVIVAVILYYVYITYFKKATPTDAGTGGGGGGGDTRACATEYTGAYTDIDSQADPLLQIGTKGNKVRELQAKIGEVVDGYFGKCTENRLNARTGATSIRYSKVSTIA